MRVCVCLTRHSTPVICEVDSTSPFCVRSFIRPSIRPSVIGRSAYIFYDRTSLGNNWPPASIFYGKTGPNRRVFFKKEQRSEPLLPLVFWFALGFLWFFALRRMDGQIFFRKEQRSEPLLPLVSCFTTDKRTSFLQERAEVETSPSSGFLLCDGRTKEFSLGKSRGRSLSFLWFFALCLVPNRTLGL